MQDQGTVLLTSTSLFERAFILIFGITLIFALLYVVGNFQGFGANTQLQLLVMVRTTGGIATVGAVITALLEMLLMSMQPTLRRVLRIVLILLAGAIVLGLTIGSIALLVFMGPVQGGM